MTKGSLVTKRYLVISAKRGWMRIAGSAGALILLIAATSMMLGISKQPAKAASGDWSTFLGNNARTGYNANETIINPTTASNLRLHWAHKGKGKISSQPIVVD